MSKIKHIAKQLQILASDSNPVIADVEQVRKNFNAFKSSVQRLTDTWSRDPDTRNRPNRQALSTELAKFADANTTMDLASVLDQIEEAVS